MNKRTTHALATISALSPSVLSSLLVGFGALCIFAYVYFVAASVLDVVVRQDAESSASTLLSEIAILETELIAAQHTISSRLANLDGYENDHEKVFVVRGGSSLVLGGAQ